MRKKLSLALLVLWILWGLVLAVFVWVVGDKSEEMQSALTKAVWVFLVFTPINVSLQCILRRKKQASLKGRKSIE